MITLFSPEHPLPRGEELRGSVRKLRTEERRPDVLAMRREELQLANSSRGINGGAIFSAVSWSKSLPITVLGSCNILECDSKVFSQPNLLFCCCLLAASTQLGLLTVFAQIGKKWISWQCNSSFLWPFMSR